jgi:hypothetical protein
VEISYRNSSAQPKEGIMNIAESKSNNDRSQSNKDWFSSKELKKLPDKPPEPIDLSVPEFPQPKLSAEQVERYNSLKDDTLKAYNEQKWDILENICEQRLQIIPDSLSAGKFLSQAQYELGIQFMKEKRFKSAVESLTKAFRWREKILGEGNMLTITCLSELAFATMGLGRIPESKKLATRAKALLDATISDQTSEDYILLEKKINNVLMFHV